MSEIKPYYQTSMVTQYCGHVIDVLSQLDPEIAQCVVTSPPYWGLRKYAGEQDIVWGNKHCEHEWGKEILRRDRGTAKGQTAQVGNQINEVSGVDTPQGQIGQLCGSWRGAYGLEPTPEMYVAHTIEILRAIRRVLRKDGVCFWNLGDTYFGSGCGTNDYQTPASISLSKPALYDGPRPQNKRQHSSLKPKDLTLIPFRVAIAAQEDGWWVRSVIIWSKSNPMPESVKDRPTESHEYILMLTKSKKYYWDIEAVREPMREGWENYSKSGLCKKTTQHKFTSVGLASMTDAIMNPNGRNLRSVWEISTQPFSGAHFAVFPEKIPERCILAATSEKGNCSKCGKPWERMVEHHRPDSYKSNLIDETYAKEALKASGASGTNRPLSNIFQDSLGSTVETLGWQPTCSCGAQPKPAIVIDPFSGSGRTLLVAARLGRQATGIDTSKEYCDLAIERIKAEERNRDIIASRKARKTTSQLIMDLEAAQET